MRSDPTTAELLRGVRLVPALAGLRGMRASICSSSSGVSSSRMSHRMGFARATSRPVASNGSCPSTFSSRRSRCWPPSSIRRGTGTGTWSRATSCVPWWYFRCPRRRTLRGLAGDILVDRKNKLHFRQGPIIRISLNSAEAWRKAPRGTPAAFASRISIGRVRSLDFERDRDLLFDGELTAGFA